MKPLRDGVAVVTGAAGGIGQALVIELARSGMDVVLADLDEARMLRIADDVGALGRRSSVVRTDVSSFEQVEQLLVHAVREHGSCDLAINNAGVMRTGALLDPPLSQWQQMLDVNLWGVLNGSRVFGRHFVEQGRGHIVNVASAGGVFPAPGMSLYSTTKFAVVGFTRQLRWELADEGVGVTLVVPGVINSGLHGRPESGLTHLNLRLILAGARTPEALARKVRRGVERDQPLVRCGLDVMVMSGARLLPERLLDPLGKLYARQVLRLVRGKVSKP